VADNFATGDVGSTTAGSYVSTQLSDDVRESLREELSGGNYRLTHTWKFTNVPAGSAHKLHFEGSRTGSTGDRFQFSWAPDSGGFPGTFTTITGSIISSSTETAGGADSSNFGTSGTSGTIYIRITDFNDHGTGGSQNTVTLDHLAIKTVP